MSCKKEEVKPTETNIVIYYTIPIDYFSIYDDNQIFGWGEDFTIEQSDLSGYSYRTVIPEIKASNYHWYLLQGEGNEIRKKSEGDLTIKAGLISIIKSIY